MTVTCPDCAREFKNAAGLAAHRRANHVAKKPETAEPPAKAADPKPEVNGDEDTPPPAADAANREEPTINRREQVAQADLIPITDEWLRHAARADMIDKVLVLEQCLNRMYTMFVAASCPNYRITSTDDETIVGIREDNCAQFPPMRIHIRGQVTKIMQGDKTLWGGYPKVSDP
jgi:hypothetical protein